MKTKRLMLKTPKVEDIPGIVEFLLRNKTFLAPYEPIRSDTYYTVEYWEQKIEKQSVLSFEQKGCQLFIYPLVEPQKAIGYLNFSNIVRGAFQSCTLGYALDEFAQGQGFMHEALTKAIDFIFHQQNIHRIMANYLPDNDKSAALLNKLGFTIEGRAKDYLYIHGRWADHILTSKINEQWIPS